jgi:site-specific recombinase XerD
MKTNFSLLFYMKKQKNYQNGAAPIYLRITVAGKRAEITTGRDCEPERWNSKAGRMSGSKEDAKSLNAYLDNLQSMVYDAHKSLTEEKLAVTAESIKCKFLGKEEKVHTLLEAIKDHNQKMEALVGKEYADGTLKRFEVLERHIELFLQFKYHKADIDIKKIAHEFISDFEFYLRTEKNCANNTAVKHVKNLGKIVRICISNKWIDRDPLFGYKFKTKKVDRAFLSGEELQIMADKQFATQRLSQVRDVFILCCYTGLAYSDVQRLKLSNIIKGIDGNQWICINRKKTDTRSAIPLLPAAMSILERYSNNPYCVNNDKAMPVASNQKMNEYLREIATLCTINKPLSSHIARHTFATTVTLLNGVPIESVSKMLGHTNIRTTQQYAKVLDIKVSADMALLREKYQSA